MAHWKPERPFSIDSDEYTSHTRCGGESTSSFGNKPLGFSAATSSAKVYEPVYEDESAVWGPPIVPRVPRSTGVAQRRPKPVGQFQTRIVKPIMPFLTMPYLRARRIHHLARNVHVFHMQSIYLARQALHLVILLNDAVDVEEGPDNDQYDERNDLEDELIELYEVMEEWGSDRGEEFEYDQHPVEIEQQYAQLFRERFYFHDTRHSSTDSLYQKLIAYDEKTIQLRQRQQILITSSTTIEIECWTEVNEEEARSEDEMEWVVEETPVPVPSQEVQPSTRPHARKTQGGLGKHPSNSIYREAYHGSFCSERLERFGNRSYGRSLISRYMSRGNHLRRKKRAISTVRMHLAITHLHVVQIGARRHVRRSKCRLRYDQHCVRKPAVTKEKRTVSPSMGLPFAPMLSLVPLSVLVSPSPSRPEPSLPESTISPASKPIRSTSQSNIGRITEQWVRLNPFDSFIAGLGSALQSTHSLADVQSSVIDPLHGIVKSFAWDDGQLQAFALPNSSPSSSTAGRAARRTLRDAITVHETYEEALHRVMNTNQIAMITLAATFGTGLFIGCGNTLSQGGPFGVLTAYAFAGTICWAVMSSLCEMSTHFPQKSFVGLVSTYLGPTLGFALGWTYLCQLLILPAALISTSSVGMKHVGYNQDVGGMMSVGILSPVPSATLRTILIIIAVGIDFLGIRGLRDFKLWASTFKISVLVALLVLGLTADLGGALPRKGGYQRVGFVFWNDAYGSSGNMTLQETGSFYGPTSYWAWTSPTSISSHSWHHLLPLLMQALFSYMGMVSLGTLHAKVTKTPKLAPKSVKHAYRLVFILCILGVAVARLASSIEDASVQGWDAMISRQATVSPFTIATHRLGVNGILPVVSAVFFTFALSASSSTIYTGSRILYGLALDHQAPAMFRRITAGQPLVALVASLLAFLGYLGLRNSESVLGYVVNLTATAGGINIICILWTYRRFRNSLQGQRDDLDTSRFMSPKHSRWIYFAIAGTFLITISNVYEGYRSKLGIVGIAISYFFFLLLGWKLYDGGRSPLHEFELSDIKQELPTSDYL